MNIDYMQVGERIRKKRKELGYTQANLAEKVNLSTEYICEIETGRKSASLMALTGISEIIGLSIDEIVFGKYPVEASVRALAILLKDCTDYERKILCDNMKSLKFILRDNREL